MPIQLAAPPPSKVSKTGMIRVPLEWFLCPLFARLKRMVKPATTKTARSMQSLKMKMPRACMEKLLEGLDDDCLPGFSRAASGAVKPTRVTGNNRVWHYSIQKASTVGKILTLEKADLTKGPNGKLPKGPSKRGLGAAMLILSKANQKRKMGSKRLAQVAGTLTFTYVEPKKMEDMGTLVLAFMVFSMDHTGHIIWPSNFSDRSRAILRKSARSNLEMMLSDPLYPTHPDFAHALTEEGNSVHIFQTAQA